MALDSSRLAEIDAYALQTPKAAEATINGLATYLARPARDDFEKARAIFRWMAHNISYDAEGFFSKRYGDQSAGGVLASRSAVCAGYSTLFQVLGRAAGLEVVIVEGWAKGYGYDVQELDGDMNHAWNAVKVAGAWYLLDATWGAGHLTTERQFEREFHPYYWLTPPDQFVGNHFPQDSRWQLLSMSVTKATFGSLPLLRPGFYEYRLRLPEGTGAVTRVEGGQTLLVDAPPDVQLMAAVEQGGRRLEDMWTSVKRQGAQYEVKAVFPGPGRFDLVIFAKRVSEGDMYQGVVTLSYDVNQGQPTFAGFPKVFPEFETYGLRLPEGTGAIARVESSATLLVDTPPDVLLIVAMEQGGRRLEDMWSFAQRNGGQYEFEAAFPAPGKYDLVVFAKRRSDPGAYRGTVTLSYEVTRGQPPFAGFPKTFTHFVESDVYLYAPKYSGLPKGSAQAFKLRVPRALQVAVIMGDKWEQLTGQDGTFQGTMTIVQLPVKVCAQFVAGDSYSCLIEYQ